MSSTVVPPVISRSASADSIHSASSRNTRGKVRAIRLASCPPVEVLLLHGEGAPAAAHLVDALEARGHRVSVRRAHPARAIRPDSGTTDVVISSGALPGAHVEAAALQRRGV